MSNGLTAAETRQHLDKPADGQITFLASLPPIASAITLGGDGEARIRLDLPANEADAALLLFHRGTNCLLRVTIEFLKT